MSQDKTSEAAWPLGFAADSFGAIQKLGGASAEAMTAWSQAWGALLTNRAGPVGEAMTKAFSAPTAVPNALAPVLDEIRAALKLPTFSDMPGRDLFTLPSPAPLFRLMQVSQDYATTGLPAWIKTCERFAAEVKQRQEADEGRDLEAGALLDIWNNVLDRTLMEFNRSEEFAKAQQAMLHAAAAQRRELSVSVEKTAKLFDMPTRSEMNDIYSRLHELHREVHKLRRELREARRKL